jgi:MFS transporter, ACS family, glucarate transporter
VAESEPRTTDESPFTHPTLELAPRPSGVRWTIFALSCATSWILYVHRYAFGIIKPKLAVEMDLDKVELGKLDTVFNSAYLIGQLPAGIAADLFGPHLFLGSSIVLWSLMMGMQAWAPTVVALTYVRIVFGAAQTGAFSALAKITRNWFPLASRTSVQGWVGITFGRAGAASANFLLATVMIGMLGLPWRTAFWILSGIGVALGVAFLLIFRNTPRVHPWTNEAEIELIEGPATTGPVRKLTATELFKQLKWPGFANLLTLNLQTLLSNAADILYQAWIPLYLIETHGLDYTQMGIFSALPLLGGAFGGALGGWLNDYFGRRNRRWGRSLVGLVGKAGAAALLMIAVACSGNPYLFCSLLFWVKFVGDWSLASTWGTVTDIGGSASATVFGINNAVGNVGAVVAPLIYGYVALRFGWTPVFVSVAVIYLLCAASWLLVDCTRPLLEDQPQKPV